MADTDILSALMGGGGGGEDTGTLGALKAYQNSPFLQGETSHSGPLGQISQAIMPILASKIYGEQASRQQEAEKVKTLVSVLTLVKELKGTDLQDAKTRAELKKLGIENDILDHFHNLNGSVNGDGKTDFRPGSKINIGGLTIPLGPEEGKTLEERAAGGDALALKGLQLKTGEADAAAARVTQRSEALAAESEQRRLDKEQRTNDENYRKKIQGGQAAAIDPTTFRKMPNATLDDEKNGRVVTLPKNDALIATQIEEGMRQLYELKRVLPKVLPKDSPNSLRGLFVTPVHAAEVKAKIARRDPDAVAFDRLRALSKYPVIQIINKNPMRFPLAEMKDIQERGGIQDSDTQQSANVLIDQALSNLRYTGQVLGLDPTDLEKSISGGGFQSPEGGPQSSGNGSSSPAVTPGASPATPSGNTPQLKATPASIKQTMNDLTGMKKSPQEIQSILEFMYGKGALDIDLGN